MNIGIACVVGRLKKNRKYKCAGTWSLVSIKKHTEDQDLCQKFCRCKSNKISQTFLDVASCNVLKGCLGKIYFRFLSHQRV